jgi:F-type H+-transporting ATPase subunit gamma
MATAREIKKRIRSVKNISQITRALEAVSASRVRKAQARVLASRAFSEKAWEILLNVQATAAKGVPLHPLLTSRDEIKQVMVVLITSDRGLAGAFNSNITRVAMRFAQRLGKPVKFVTVGRKGRDSLIRMKANVVAEFSYLPTDPKISDISPIARLAIDEFLSGNVDDVFVAYTDFINTLTQRPAVLSWLPMQPFTPEDNMLSEMIKDMPHVTAQNASYEYEPGAAAILDEIVPRFTELQLYQAVLESQASEHSARMVAMRNASDNAVQLTADLTLMYNKARQAAITAEILDIVGGAEALQDTIDAVADEILTSRDGGSASGTADDLTLINGITAKTEAALKAAGIDSYYKLAQSTEDHLAAAIKAAGGRKSALLPTWPTQAAYAVRGDMEGLKQFQSEQVAGRKV